ncbi:origin recognition complex subunit 6 [Danaus plexippus plexippus]|uniref:Origin recognition complex subunit 6 n=1 Tax=Danaus plexippus plexippus TaxID=278856 RepID=A0A212ELK0_DANPL|nr:origin recognition complex subunit 6 [Danaus plexippus plexippus]
MAFHNKTLKIIASKLGLGEEDKVLNKAAEFERLLQTKLTANILSDTSKTVICLDLAAEIFDVDLDRKSAIKYSGLKGPSYNNNRKTVENLLDLKNDKLTVQFLCLSLQCTGLQSLAEKILQEYQKEAKTEIDLNLPQYVCMAVHQASRINKVKLAKSKLVEKSRLRLSQWSKLDTEWTKFVDEKFDAVKRKVRTSKNIQNNEQIENMEVDQRPEEKSSEPKIEEYEDWKKRMLEAAYRELRELEKIEKDAVDNKDNLFLSPRRSPRKTPQKFSPYKSPRTCVPTGGIRLLFPKDL